MGLVQDEIEPPHGPRRAYEYASQYGLSLFGQRGSTGFEAADNRSKFLRSFHELLALCVKFFEADDDTTVIADPFPVLNALKEVHMVLAEGAHNQFGDLPWVSRVEMHDHAVDPRAPGVPRIPRRPGDGSLREAWMDRVDSMRRFRDGETRASPLP